MSSGSDDFERRASVEMGFRMPETRPASVSKLALSRTVSQMRIGKEGEEVSKSISYSTLPPSVILIVNGTNASAFSRAEGANKKIREIEEAGEEARVGSIGIVQPDEEDGEQVSPELVVIEQGRAQVGEPFADGQRMSIEGEKELVEKFVGEHPDLFPPNPKG